jgi:hypothetical protein
MQVVLDNENFINVSGILNSRVGFEELALMSSSKNSAFVLNFD